MGGSTPQVRVHRLWLVHRPFRRSVPFWDGPEREAGIAEPEDVAVEETLGVDLGAVHDGGIPLHDLRVGLHDETAVVVVGCSCAGSA